MRKYLSRNYRLRNRQNKADAAKPRERIGYHPVMSVTQIFMIYLFVIRSKSFFCFVYV